MTFTKTLITLVSLSLLFPSLSQAKKKPNKIKEKDEIVGASCFPVGQGWRDNSCYAIDNKEECQDRHDEYACGWGISKEIERMPNADNERVCESARCSEHHDDEVEEE